MSEENIDIPEGTTDDEPVLDEENIEELELKPSSPEIENIIRAIKKNEKTKKPNEIIKINYKVLIDKKTKLIRPLVTLSGTAVIAVVTYLRNFPTDRWFVVVFSALVIFLGFGTFIQGTVEKFEIEVVKKEIDDRLEYERKLEEAKAKEEAERLAAENEEDQSF